MNTHILIPIKDIKDIIKRYRKDIDTSERGGDNIRAAAFTHMIDGLETAAKLGKQISLDETDIEEKATLHSKINGDNLSERLRKLSSKTMANIFEITQANRLRGYKQALKDLL